MDKEHCQGNYASARNSNVKWNTIILLRQMYSLVVKQWCMGGLLGVDQIPLDDCIIQLIVHGGIQKK